MSRTDFLLQITHIFPTELIGISIDPFPVSQNIQNIYFLIEKKIEH